MTPTYRRFWNFFPLFWLIFMVYPIFGIYEKPHSLLEYVFFWALLISFVTVYVWVSIGRRDNDERWAFFGWGMALVTYLLTQNMANGGATAFLIYGGSLIGFQSRMGIALWFALINVMFMVSPFWIGKAELSDLTWLLPNMFITLITAYGSHAGYMQQMMRGRLNQVQLEKEKLAADAERERIARDLHDVLGHTLSVIVLKSELASKLAEKDPTRAAQEIREVERISREALQEVRSAVRGYRGSGFGAELARAKVALDAAGVKLTITDSLPDLPAVTEASAAMLLREAITNVVRHAKAKEVQISLNKMPKGYTLTIHDNGIGGNAPEGTGLTGMRERLQAIGGNLERDGRSGTRLTAFLPEDEPASSGSAMVTA